MTKKNATKVTIREPNAPMTDKQTYKLYMITGVTMYYMDEYPYTQQQASDLIDDAMNGKAYHVRVICAEWEGAKVSWKDVGKAYRDDPKPKGYAHAMEVLSGETVEEEEEVKEPPKKNRQFKKPPKQKQGKTKAQKKAALQAKYERELKALDTPAKPKTAKDTPKDNGKPSEEEAQEALFTMLSESSGIDIEKVRRMAQAFSA